MFRNSIARFTKNCTTSSKLCAKLYLNSSFLSSNNVSLNGTGTLARNSSTSSSVGSESWNWIPPRKHGESNELSEHDVTIPVIKNQLLTTAEIEKALELQGGKNIVSMDIKGNLDTIKQFVIVTGRSSRHMRKMADTIVSALKSRNLRMAPGYTGVEGDKDDDWMVVDCHDIVVNFMLASKCIVCVDM